MTVVVIELLARHAWWPLGWLATVWAGFGARRPLNGADIRKSIDAGDYLDVLVDVVAAGRDPVARWQAGRRLGRLWARSTEHRAAIWHSVWSRFSESPRWSFSESPPEVAETDMSRALARFLLGPDPGARHVPPVRLVAMMASDDDSDRPAGRTVILSQTTGDPKVRAGLADLLTRTDEPHLLAALERAFLDGVTFGGPGTGPLYGPPVLPLWEGPDDTPTGLLTVLLRNPHLPRPPEAGDDARLAVLAVLRDRSDLLDRFDQRDLVRRLLYLRLSPTRGRSPVVDAGNSVLYSLAPGPGREEICRLAMRVGTDSHAVGVLDDAARIAVATGYRPADPALEPLFLVMTSPSHMLLAGDAEGRRLREYAARLGSHAQVRRRLDEAARSRPGAAESGRATGSSSGSGGGRGVSGSGGYSTGGGFSVHGV